MGQPGRVDNPGVVPSSTVNCGEIYCRALMRIRLISFAALAANTRGSQLVHTHAKK